MFEPDPFIAGPCTEGIWFEHAAIQRTTGDESGVLFDAGKEETGAMSAQGEETSYNTATIIIVVVLILVAVIMMASIPMFIFIIRKKLQDQRNKAATSHEPTDSVADMS